MYVRLITLDGRRDYPVGGYEVQHWAKPVGGGSAALLVINSNATHTKTVSVELKDVFNVGKTVDVRDIWTHTDNGTATQTFVATVPPADSIFVLLKPSSNANRVIQ